MRNLSANLAQASNPTPTHQTPLSPFRYQFHVPLWAEYFFYVVSVSNCGCLPVVSTIKLTIPFAVQLNFLTIANILPPLILGALRCLYASGLHGYNLIHMHFLQTTLLARNPVLNQILIYTPCNLMSPSLLQARPPQTTFPHTSQFTCYIATACG